jgi:hypothetical protein
VAAGVKFGRKRKLSDYQRAEAASRTSASDALPMSSILAAAKSTRASLVKKALYRHSRKVCIPDARVIGNGHRIPPTMTLRNYLTCGLLSAVPDAQRRLEYQKASADFTQSCHKSNRRF